jgi:phosphoenolpyruvate carboxylase
MLDQFALFDDLIHNPEMGLAKAVSIARLYAGRVADESSRGRVFGMVAEEFERTSVFEMLQLVGLSTEDFCESQRQAETYRTPRPYR